jgi:hypothetical protein
MPHSLREHLEPRIELLIRFILNAPNFGNLSIEPRVFAELRLHSFESSARFAVGLDADSDSAR